MKRSHIILLIVTLFTVSLFATQMVSAADTIKKPTGGSYERPGMDDEEDEDAFSLGKEETTIEDNTPQYLDKGIIGNVIKRRYTAIKFCYQKELNRNKKLKGTVAVQFAIQLNGKVKNVKINNKRSSLKNGKVRKCIVEKIKQLQFPERSKGEPQVITFPFRFDAKK